MNEQRRIYQLENELAHMARRLEQRGQNFFASSEESRAVMRAKDRMIQAQRERDRAIQERDEYRRECKALRKLLANRGQTGESYQ